MRQVRWASWMGAVAMTVALGGATPAAADVASDRAAAIVVYPWVVTSEPFVDTVIQLSNTSREGPIDVWCFYENANPHCTNTGDVCFAAEDCCDGYGCGICLPGWSETDFFLRLTPLQPLAWLASDGLSEFPIDGVDFRGSDGSSNAGSRVPPVPEDPFIGELKCIAISPEGVPIDANVLKGEATLEQFLPFRGIGASPLDVAKYNAVGIQAIPGAVNDDKVLVLGGDGAEYNGCPNVNILNHFSDFVADPATGEYCAPTNDGSSEGCIETQLVIVPCTQDLLRQIPGSAVVQYLVFNEFEQRFSTSRTARCQQALPISNIDTTQRLRSIFSAGVLGTVSAQTRFTPIGSGLIGVAIESHDGREVSIGDSGEWAVGAASGLMTRTITATVRNDSAAFNLHIQGDRPDSDFITLP